MNSSLISQPPFENVMMEIADEPGFFLKNNRLDIPVKTGNGYIRIMKLEDGLDVLITSAMFAKTINSNCTSDEDEYYFLHFYEEMKVIGFEKMVGPDSTPAKGCVKWASSLTGFNLAWMAETKVQSVCIAIHNSWMEKTFADMDIATLVNRSCLGIVNDAVDFIDAEYKFLLNDLFQLDVELPLRNLFIKNRVLLLIEKFFTRQSRRLNNSLFDSKKLNEELPRLMQVEAALINSIYDTAPTIDALAKMAAMSATKLKCLFKQILGMPVYEYYQHHRMQVAKSLLLTGKYSVKEAGQKMGYHNISHFAAAFKKVHGILPGSLAGSR